MIFKKNRKFLWASVILVTLLRPDVMAHPVSSSNPIKTDLRTQRASCNTTLPLGLTRKIYLQCIASELGWIPSKTETEICGGYFNEPDIIKNYPHPLPVKEESALVTAKGPVILLKNGTSKLKDRVVVTQQGRIVQADTAYLYRDPFGKIRRITLIGHVKLQEANRLIVSDKTIITLPTKSAQLINIAYHIYSRRPFHRTLKGPANIWGTASSGTQNESNVITLNNATYTTCAPTRPAWQVSAKHIQLDTQNHRGEAYGTTVRFYDFPLFYFPYFAFGTNHERKTGFLTPKLGYDNRSGGNIQFPLYLNLAPNYDLTFTFEYYTLRNADLTALFRFMSARSLGTAYISYLPDDTQYGRFRRNAINTFSNPLLYNPSFFKPYLDELMHSSNARGFFSMEDMTRLNSEWFAKINVNYVTDPYYFQDLGGVLESSTLSDQLLNRVDLRYSGWHWEFRGMLQAYQTLHIINQTQYPALDQYQRLPDLSLQGYYSDILNHLDFLITGSFVNFSYQSDYIPNKPIGQRLHVRPGFSFPLESSFGYFMPQVWLDATAYNVEHPQPGQANNPDRILPILNIDSGLYFDRNFTISSHHYLQTLEPRIFYLYVPYQNQNRLPNFDTVLLPFFFEEIFALNRFTGDDRLDNANQFSLAFTSRIIDSDDGAEVLNANMGFIYRMANPKVCLSEACTEPNLPVSPVLAELVFYLPNRFSLSGNIAWDPNAQQTNNASINLHYEDTLNRVANISYTFVHENGASIVPGVVSMPTSVYSNNTSELILSLAWPLNKNWSTVGYWSYNMVLHRTDKSLLGFQYDTCCWVLRLVAELSFLGATLNSNGNYQNRYDATYFIQLQLKGLGDFGTGDVGKMLSTTIPGFQH